MQGADTTTAATARSNEAAGIEMFAVFREVNVDDLYALIIFPVVAAA